jgi:hypothetical protein
MTSSVSLEYLRGERKIKHFKQSKANFDHSMKKNGMVQKKDDKRCLNIEKLINNVKLAKRREQNKKLLQEHLNMEAKRLK